VTYITSESGSEKTAFVSSTINKLLDLTAEAAQRKDWFEVSQSLKQIPQGKDKLWLLEETNWHKVFNLAVKMLTESDFQHQWEVTKIFPRLGANIITPLASCLLDNSLEVEIRWFICQILGNFTDQRVVVTLVKLLQQTEDEELIAIAGKTLSKIGDGAISALVKLSVQSQYRLLAIQSLCYIHTLATIEPLLTVTQDDKPEIRTMAIKALGSFHDCRIPPILIDALQDIASNVRREAAIALGFRSDLASELNLIGHLKLLLQDLNLEVCRQAAISLGRIKQKEANFALYEVLQKDTTPISLKLNIVKALGWSNLSSAIDYLKLALVNQNELLSQEIIVTLGRIESLHLKQKAAQVLVEFWQSKQPSSVQIKQVLANSLGELGCKCARTTLKQLGLDCDHKVKLYANAALQNIS